MSDQAAQRRITPRIVSSIEDAVVARRRINGQSRPGHSPTEQLLQAMYTVKAARFAAAERLERKHLVSVIALSMVSLYFVGLSVWQTVYGASLSEAAVRLITIVSVMSSICTLVLALIDSMNDYKIKAHHMHTCALAVNDVLQDLRTQPPVNDVAVLQEFRRRYNDVVRSCPYNHRRVDYLVARAQRSTRWETKIWAHSLRLLDVYGFYGLCVLAPPTVLMLFA